MPEALSERRIRLCTELPLRRAFNNQTFPFTNYNGLPFINQNHTFNFIDNVSKIIGSHTIKAGFYAQRSRKDQTVFARTDGDINFANNANHPLNTQHPYSNALLGIYNSYIQANVTSSKGFTGTGMSRAISRTTGR